MGGDILILVGASAVAAWQLHKTLRTGEMQVNFFLPDRSKVAHPALYWLNVGLLAAGAGLGLICAVFLLLRSPH